MFDLVMVLLFASLAILVLAWLLLPLILRGYLIEANKKLDRIIYLHEVRLGMRPMPPKKNP